MKMKNKKWNFLKKVIISFFILFDIWMFAAWSSFNLDNLSIPTIASSFPFLLHILYNINDFHISAILLPMIFILPILLYLFQQKFTGRRVISSEMMQLLKFSFFSSFIIINSAFLSLWLFLLFFISIGQFD